LSEGISKLLEDYLKHHGRLNERSSRELQEIIWMLSMNESLVVELPEQNCWEPEEGDSSSLMENQEFAKHYGRNLREIIASSPWFLIDKAASSSMTMGRDGGESLSPTHTLRTLRIGSLEHPPP